MSDHRSAREEIAQQIREWQRKKNDPAEWHVTKERREKHGITQQERILKAMLYAIYPLATFAFGCAIGWMMHR